MPDAGAACGAARARRRKDKWGGPPTGNLAPAAAAPATNSALVGAALRTPSAASLRSGAGLLSRMPMMETRVARPDAWRSGRWTLLPLLAAFAACDTAPVRWDEPRQLAAPGAASGAAAPALAAGLAVNARGEVAAQPEASAAVAPPPEAAGPVCPGSLRLAHGVSAGGAGQLYAVWWAARPDGTAALLAARSDDDGRSWARTLPVDTLDRGATGCARPAPAVAADSANGYVHVVYYMQAPEGPGLFYAHLMDARASFEPPVSVVYGERPAAASVASRGDTVAVAYESPNGRLPRIELALSYAAGHRFDHRNVVASGSGAAAAQPSVAVGGGRVAVAWLEGRAAGAEPSADEPSVSGATAVVRTGRLQP